MEIISDSFNLVIIGDWNKAYIDPSWLAEKVFKVEKFELNVIFKEFDYQMQVKSNDIAIVPSQNRVTIICTNASEEGIKEFERVCNSFLKECISPQIKAYGFNLTFKEDDTTIYSEIADNISDTSLLVNNGATIQSTDIIRKFMYKNKPYSLNFSLKEGKLNMAFNSHHDCNSANNMISIPENTISNFKQHCIEILSFYGYSMEEEE